MFPPSLSQTFWALRGWTQDYCLVLGPEQPTGTRPASALFIEPHLEKWLRNPLTASVLRSIDKALGGTPPLGSTACQHAAYERQLIQRIIRALRSRRLAAWEVAKASLEGQLPPPHKQAPPSVPETAVEDVTAFTIELTTVDDLYIPMAAYEATFASGEKRSGVLDAKGKAVVMNPPPGPVIVTYTDMDDVAAKALAVSARKALDGQEFGAVFDLLMRDAPTVKKAIASYDAYFNDLMGNGFVEDLNAVFTDPDAHAVVLALLARSGIAVSDAPQYHEWRAQDEG